VRQESRIWARRRRDGPEERGFMLYLQHLAGGPVFS
jgi:hypothetical protein